MRRLTPLAMVAVVVAGTAGAEPLAVPAGEVLLTVTGAIAETNGEAGASFDRAMLEALGMHSITTSTAWTDGIKTFEGPLMRDLLAAVGATGSEVVATALDDYRVTIPVNDFAEYPVLLAIDMDDAALSLRDYGPAWIVYPRDEHPELATEVINTRWIWSVFELEVR